MCSVPPIPLSDATWKPSSTTFCFGVETILTSILLCELRIYSDDTTNGDCRSSGKTSQDVFGEFSFVFLLSLDMFCGGLTR